MKNKRGWIRILEATISILLVSSVLVVVYSGQVQREDLGGYIFNVQNQVLLDIGSRADLRAYVLNEDIDEIQAYVSDKVPSFLGYAVRICDLGDACRISGAGLDEDLIEAIKSQELYVEETVVSADIYSGGLSPKKVKIFVWEIQGEDQEVDY